MSRHGPSEMSGWGGDKINKRVFKSSCDRTGHTEVRLGALRVGPSENVAAPEGVNQAKQEARTGNAVGLHEPISMR